MRSNLFKQVKKMSQYALYALTLQAIFCSLAVAHSGSAQEKKLSEVYVSVDWDGTSFGNALSDLEGKTEFQFSYNKLYVDLDRKIMITETDKSLDQVLLSLAKQTKLGFKRINETIHVVEPPRFGGKKSLVTDIVEKTITGKVTGEDAEPLPGANVLVKGTTIGTVTDVDGNYSLEVPDDANTLVFSYVGYLSQEVNIGSSSVINMELQADIESLSEVVVIGYGTQKKENLTGSIATVTAKEIEARPITSVATALQGTTSGVFINQNSGQAGRDDVIIRIRGVGTLNNSNPLILIDGIEGPLNNINPSDVESITVLKDAASSAIYGSRAANGVVLVTTKRGKSNTKPTLTYDGFIGTSEATSIPVMVNDAVDFADLVNEAADNFGQQRPFSDDQLAGFAANRERISTDWMDAVFRTAAIQQHNLAFSGGTDRTNFRFSFGYLDQEGIAPQSDFQRYNLRLNLDTEINDKVRVGTSLSYIRGDRDSPIEDLSTFGEGALMTRAVQSLPLSPIFDDQGRFAAQNPEFGNSSTNNALIEAYAREFNRISTEILTSAYIEWEPISGLTFKGTAAVNSRQNKDNSFVNSLPIYDWITGEERVFNPIRSKTESHGQSFNYTLWATAQYERSFGQHNLTALVGYNEEESESENFQAFRNGHLSNEVKVLDVGLASTSTNGGSATSWDLDLISVESIIAIWTVICLRPIFGLMEAPDF